MIVEQCQTTAMFSTKLVLEAAVFEEGYTWHSQSEPKKNAMEKSSSSAIPLWESQVTWHKPLAAFSLLTTPGINYFTTDTVACSDPQLRWAMSWVVNECRKGGIISSATEWTEYLKALSPTYPTTSPRHGFVVAFAHEPVFSTQTPGRRMIHNIGQASLLYQNPIPINVTNLLTANNPAKITVIRKGRAVTISEPSARLCRTAKPTAMPKYSSSPKEQFRLSPSALPAGAPPEFIEAATRAFASSVSVRTQDNYNTAWNHLVKAEDLLGRKFCNPPLQSEMAFFTTYLIQKGLTKATISNYMSGLRYIIMSRGAHSPTPPSDLSSQLVSGLVNIKKDAVKEATKCRRRPITLNMLILLQHSIATDTRWSQYGKSLRWSVILLGFWGSFRMGELISKEKFRFHESTSLLPTDIQFKEDCVSIWIRSPKVWSEGGDVVEVWSVQENPNLDPVAALSCFMKFRSGTFGEAEKKPVFIHEDGSLYSNTELNQDLKSLLSKFPSLTNSSREHWSGHSFRAGLATLLTSLGFSEEKIKSWGRWRSMAYMAYAQDMTMRRKTRMELSSLFGRMLMTLN